MAIVEVVSATPALSEEKPEAAVKEEVIAQEPEPEAVNEEAKEEQTVAVEEVPAPVVAAVEHVSEEKEVKEGEEVAEVAEEEEKEKVSEPKDTCKVAPKPVIEEEKAVVAEAEESSEEKVVVAAEEIKEGGKVEGERERPLPRGREGRVRCPCSIMFVA